MSCNLNGILEKPLLLHKRALARVTRFSCAHLPVLFNETAMLLRGERNCQYLEIHLVHSYFIFFPFILFFISRQDEAAFCHYRIGQSD